MHGWWIIGGGYISDGYMDGGYIGGGCMGDGYIADGYMGGGYVGGLVVSGENFRDLCRRLVEVWNILSVFLSRWQLKLAAGAWSDEATTLHIAQDLI